MIFKFGRGYEKEQHLYQLINDVPIGTSGRSGTNPQNYLHSMNGIKKYYFKGKYPKPR